MGEEDPLKNLAVLIRVCLRVPTKLVILVVVLLKVQKDGSGLKDREIIARVVNEDWDTTVRV